MNTNSASASTKLISDAGGFSSSCVAPVESVYCTGSTDSQFAIRMNTNSVTASGNTKGAIFMPIAVSIWLRSWIVIASQNSWTPPGTPVDVTFARKKNASAITITAAIAVASTVSVLTVSPNQLAV